MNDVEMTPEVVNKINDEIWKHPRHPHDSTKLYQDDNATEYFTRTNAEDLLEFIREQYPISKDQILKCNLQVSWHTQGFLGYPPGQTSNELTIEKAYEESLKKQNVFHTSFDWTCDTETVCTKKSRWTGKCEEENTYHYFAFLFITHKCWPIQRQKKVIQAKKQNQKNIEKNSNPTALPVTAGSAFSPKPAEPICSTSQKSAISPQLQDLMSLAQQITPAKDPPPETSIAITSPALNPTPHPHIHKALKAKWFKQNLLQRCFEKKTWTSECNQSE